MNASVYIVDDHQLLRNGLRQAIERDPAYRVVGEASRGPEAVAQMTELKPDLVIMDIHLPGMNGIETTRQILQSHPAAKVVVLSADGDRELVDAALEAGACGYILKDSVVEELIQALRVILTGKLYLSPSLSASILEEYRRALLRPPEDIKPVLTEQETRLLRLIVEGRRNKEIALQMQLSTKSIETYRSRLMKRLGCENSAELIRYAIREGIARP